MPQVGPDRPRRKPAAASTRRPYPVLTLRETLFFPLTTFPLAVGQEASLRAVEEASRGARQLVLLAQKQSATEEPLAADLSTAVAVSPFLPDELVNRAMNHDNPWGLRYLIASSLRGHVQERLEVLELDGLRAKYERVQRLLEREIELLELGHKLRGQPLDNLDEALDLGLTEP